MDQQFFPLCSCSLRGALCPVLVWPGPQFTVALRWPRSSRRGLVRVLTIRWSAKIMWVSAKPARDALDRSSLDMDGLAVLRPSIAWIQHFGDEVLVR